MKRNSFLTLKFGTALIAVAALVSSCAIAGDSRADGALAAIQSARLRSCPPDREQPNARFEGFGPQTGVQIDQLGIVSMSGEPARVVRLVRVTLAPGGVIGWHTHGDAQGMALLISGGATEVRNTCLDTLTYRAGDIAREDAGTAHAWRNDGAVPAVFLVVHGLAGE